MRNIVLMAGLLGVALFTAAMPGCGSGLTLFNPEFINTTTGGANPVTPGPGAAFVFVRGVNETTQTLEFVVTIERQVLDRDDNGNFVFDDFGQPLTTPKRETRTLLTFANGPARELGVLFSCRESPVTHVGLGANLLPGDTAIFVGGQGAIGQMGSGIQAPNLNTLLLSAGNFNCGDTIIYRAFTQTNVSGGIGVEAFLLPGSEQPSVFSGPNTFVNFAEFLQAQDSAGGP